MKAECNGLSTGYEWLVRLEIGKSFLSSLWACVFLCVDDVTWPQGTVLQTFVSTKICSSYVMIITYTCCQLWPFSNQLHIFPSRKKCSETCRWKCQIVSLRNNGPKKVSVQCPPQRLSSTWYPSISSKVIYTIFSNVECAWESVSNCRGQSQCM